MLSRLWKLSVAHVSITLQCIVYVVAKLNHALHSRLFSQVFYSLSFVVLSRESRQAAFYFNLCIKGVTPFLDYNIGTHT